ncbi:hypothetical protein KAH27_02200 [bacterium]|nr:hypothetical protein [bacterium]
MDILFPKTKNGKIRFFIIIGFAVILDLYVLFFVINPLWAYKPQEGDIIFQSLPKGILVNIIEGVTHSPFSHCGVVIKENNKWVVNEAIGDVHSTPLWIWILRGRSLATEVFRVKNPYSKFIPDFIKALDKYQGRTYDINYKMDEENIYCSELVFKAFRDVSKIELGKLYSLGELDWIPYKNDIEYIEGGTVPTNRIMITPKHLSEAEELKKVYSFGY